MAVPKQRHTKSKRNKRRMHYFIPFLNLIECSKCGKLKKPHIVCPFCGYYKGREIINVLEKLEKKEKKEREKEIKMREKEKRSRPLTLKELSRKKF